MGYKKRKKKSYSLRNEFHENKRNKEFWRTISGYEPTYQVKVSDRGRVVIVPEIKTDDDGREFVVLAGRDVPIDLLVAQAFIPNSSGSEVPIHKNGNMADSRVLNLKWLPHAEDPDAPGRMTNMLSMLTYILKPSLLAERDKEFTKFYTYIEYLWKTGQMPRENEQMIMDLYDEHKKRVTEDWISTNLYKESLKKQQHTSVTDTQLQQETENLQETQTPYQDSVTLDSQLPSHQLSHQSIDSQSTPYTEEDIISKPFKDIPKELMARALVDLYERCQTRAESPEKNRGFTVMPIDDIVPDLIVKAIRRVVNQGYTPVNTWFDSKNHIRNQLTSPNYPGQRYVNYADPKVMFAESLTAPYHLNMLPQLPPIGKDNKVPRTSHIQSLLNQMKKDGDMPDWAFESVLSVVGSELYNKLGLSPESTIEEFAARVSELKKELQDKRESITEETGISEKRVQSSDMEEESIEDMPVSNRPVIQRVDYWGDSYMTTAGIGSSDKSKEKSNNNILSFGSSSGTSSSLDNVQGKSGDSGHTGGRVAPSSGSSSDKSVDKNAENRENRENKSGSLSDISDLKEFIRKNTEDLPGDSNYMKNGKVVEYPYREDELGNEVHKRREKVYTVEEIKLFRLVKHINTLPEWDEKGRPLYDSNLFPLQYDDSLEVPVAPARYCNMFTHAPAMLLRNESRMRQSRELARWLNDKKSLEESGKLSDGSDISPLYDPDKDITKGMINTKASLEESSYYNERGQKVYHNVRYGQRYDPEIHTLFIPEMFEFPDMFNLKMQKELYLADYVRFLKNHNPEIGNPDILKKYYETAKAAKSIMSAIPNSAKQKLYGMKGAGVAVRGWMPDGECVVFPSIKAASEATGCPAGSIAASARGEKPYVYGIRWELVDLSDMDTMINRYIDRVMEICEQGDVQVDWDQYISPEARKRMKKKLECVGSVNPEKWNEYRRGLLKGFPDEDFDKWEPGSETGSYPEEHIEPDGIMDSEIYEDVLKDGIDGDGLRDEDILFKEIIEFEEKRKKKRENTLNKMLDEMLGSDSEE